MKRLFILFAAAAMIFAGGCSDKYDDSALTGRVDNLENRVAKLEELCRQMNTNISSLQSIVTALQANDYITSCAPLMENGVQIGYTLTFAKSGSIVIYHGQNGKNGANGADGKDGQDGADGKDGHTPVFGAKADPDGILCWTVDGEWLLTENGFRIPVRVNDGEDGITPQLKIEEGYWYVSYDNGGSWTQLGKATGEDGQDGTNGEAFFQDVTQDKDYVYLTISTGEQIAVPKQHPLSITFDKTDEMYVRANQTYSIGYTLTGADDQTIVKALAQDGFRAVVKKTDNASGTIEITTPATILSSEVLVFVSDGKERTIMRSINFVEGVILITTKSYTVGNEGGTVKIDLSTNLDYTVLIPDAATSWISVEKIESRAMRDETITLNVAPNPTAEVRYSEVRLMAFGVTNETILITQKEEKEEEEADDTEIVQFADELFKEYMVARFDKNKDGEISRYEASLITEIVCQNQTIQSLEGIEYCTALTELDCQENQLTALDVSNNTALTKLYCSSNPLTTLDVSKNTALTYLSCVNNQLTTLDVSKNISLKGLNCSKNQLTILDVSNNTALTSLSCQSNQLTTLDVSKNTALTYLSCGSNQLTTLNVSGCSALTELNCCSNLLTALDVSGCSALTGLSCFSNQLTTLDVSGCSVLKDLTCEFNQLTALDVSNNTRLEYLHCYSNQLTSLDVSKNTGLKTLNCNTNQLTSLDASKHTALTYLNCYGNQLITLDVNGCSALEVLICEMNLLTTLDVSKTNLGNSTENRPLDCSTMPTLQTLYLKTGWEIKFINVNRSTNFIPAQTEILYKD